MISILVMWTVLSDFLRFSEKVARVIELLHGRKDVGEVDSYHWFISPILREGVSKYIVEGSTVVAFSIILGAQAH
jgi:hypothetical protein